MNFFRVIFILLSLAALPGCRSRAVGAAEVQAPDVPDTAVPAVEPAELPAFMTVTVIRIEPEKRTEPELQILVRGELVAVVGNQSYVTFDLPVGTNTVTFNWEDTPLEFPEEIVLDPGWPEQKFLSVVHKFDVPEIERNDKNVDYTLVETLALFELPAAYAREVLKNLDPELSYVFDYPHWWEDEKSDR